MIDNNGHCVSNNNVIQNVILDLDPFTRYSVMLAAVSEYGVGPFSEEIQVLTFEDGGLCRYLAMVVAIDV